MKRFFAGMALIVSLAAPAQSAVFTDIYSSFYSFGDSLSDDGKFSQLDSPSFGGRYTNGFVWAEYFEFSFLAEGSDAGNLALGGATGNDVNQISSGPLSTFKRQIETFTDAVQNGVGLPTKILPTQQFSPTAPTPGDNPLLSVWFGANDLFQGVSPIAAANAVTNGIRMLNDIDPGKFDDFLVIALPDLGQTPALTGNEDLGSALTNLYNLQLALNMQQLRQEGLNIIEYDPNGVLERILDSINSFTFEYGIFNASIPCTISMGAALVPDQSNPYTCEDFFIDPDWLLFADGVHPNAKAHQLLAQDIAQLLNDMPGSSALAAAAAVPVPASLSLMLVVLAGLGIASRRRLT